MRTLASFALLTLAATAAADTLVLEEGVDGYAGTQDLSIFGDEQNNASAQDPVLYIGNTQSRDPRRGFLRFDLSQLPPGAQIGAVSLRLTVDRAASAANHTYRLHRVTMPWEEGPATSAEPDQGGLGTPAVAGDVTWLDRLFPETAWNAPGGDFATVQSASAVAGAEGTEMILSSPAMVADVQGWVSNPETNFGWIVIGDESGSRTARRFDSSEGEAGKRPRLTIEYAYTAPATGERWELH